MNSEFLSLLNFKLGEEVIENFSTRQGPFEVRMNPRMICAKISIPNYESSSLSSSLKILGEYLDGNNFRVEMIQRHNSHFQTFKTNSVEVGYILCPSLKMADVPKPISRLIKIEECLSTRVGVLKFKGGADVDKIHRRGEELRKWLHHRGWKYYGPLTFTTDNFLISNLRTNEVQIDLL